MKRPRAARLIGPRWKTSAQVCLIATQVLLIYVLAARGADPAMLAAATLLVDLLLAVFSPSLALAVGTFALALPLVLPPVASASRANRVATGGEVRGTVLLDELPQVGVVVCCGATGTDTTAIDGQFTLRLPKGGRLDRLTLHLATTTMVVPLVPPITTSSFVTVRLEAPDRPVVSTAKEAGSMLDRRTLLTSLAALVPTFTANAATRRLQLTAIDGLEIGLDRPPIFFVRNRSIVTGVAVAPRDKSVQLLTRRYGRDWVVSSATVTPRDLRAGTFEWALPLTVEEPPQTLKAVLVNEPLPTGLAVGPRWSQLIEESDAIEISSAPFDRAQLRIVDVGGRVPVPGTALSVASFEELVVHTEGLPRGSLVDVIVEPADGARAWVADRIHVTTGPRVRANAYFGRLDRILNVKREIDVHAKYWLSAVATALPLPRRPDGISPGEWLTVSRYIRASSSKVALVRAILPEQAEISIAKLGVTNDGEVHLAPRFARVEGLFAPGPRYRPLRAEIITLLVRAEDVSGTWTVASSTDLKGNRAVFILTAPDLLPHGANAERDTCIAIAVASYSPFDATRPVTDAEITRRQFALSPEVRYRLLAPRSRS